MCDSSRTDAFQLKLVIGSVFFVPAYIESEPVFILRMLYIENMSNLYDSCAIPALE